MSEKSESEIKGWPKYWKNKTSGDVFRCLPWWESLDPLLTEENLQEMGLPKEFKDRKFKIGAIVQIGWLIENEHNVWFGLSPKAASAFEEITKEQYESTEKKISRKKSKGYKKVIKK